MIVLVLEVIYMCLYMFSIAPIINAGRMSTDIWYCIHHVTLYFLCSGTQAASLVFSSQIPGYDGLEVDTTESVEITFPLIVRKQI